MSADIAVVIPCLNEAKTLGSVVERAFEAFAAYKLSGEVIVADNGSTDGSQAIARNCGARVVDVPLRGYGSALSGGIEASQADFIVIGDADDTYDFMEIDRFVKAREDGNDFVMGTRLKGHIEEGAMPSLHRYLGTPVLTALINIFFGSRISDCNCGLRGFTRKAFEEMEVHSTGMEFASEMIIKSALLKQKMVEVPVSLRVDRRGKPPHLQTWRDGWRHLRFILTYAADRLLIIPGLLMVALGVVGFALVGKGPILIGNFFMDYHFLFPSSMSILLGVQLILFTFLLKTYTGLARYDAKVRTLLESVSVEWGIATGVALFTIGLVINLNIVWTWVQSHGGALFAVRPAIIALTVMAVGAQFFFTSFVMSVLRIPQRRLVK